jgi:peptidoglycan/xylan/chitin deacetylase (PgdA/CDA1 family)
VQSGEPAHTDTEDDIYEYEPAIPAWARIDIDISITEPAVEYIDGPGEPLPSPSADAVPLEDEEGGDEADEPDEPDGPGEPQTELVFKELIYLASREPNHALYESGEKLVALTFDDGPGIFTDELLDMLIEHESLATFFIVGSRIGAHPQTVRNMADHGFEVVGHSWNHPNFLTIEEEDIRFQLQATNTAIFNITGIRPLMHRVPGGNFDDLVLEVSYDLGMSVIQWNLDPRDWEVRNAEIIYDIIMSRVRHGSIIVLHDIHSATIDAMERVIPDLIEAGFILVTVSELLGETEPGVVYYGG